jgi:hypothetical protein
LATDDFVRAPKFNEEEEDEEQEGKEVDASL